MNTGARAYRQLDISTQIEAADEHTLIKMLFDGGIERLHRARGCIQRGDVSGRNKSLGEVVAIIAGLQGSLDMERGGELAANLDALYDYMQRRIHRANVDQDTGPLQEVIDLLSTLQEAWSAIGSEVQRTVDV